MRASKGFTLIELLVVIAILGILGAVLFVTIGGTPQRDARDSRRLSDLNNLTTAIALYQSEIKSMPTSIEGSSNSLTNAPNGKRYIGGAPADPRHDSGTCDNSNFDGNFPDDPSAGAYGYYYEQFTDSNGVERGLLASCLEDTDNSALEGDVDDANALGASVGSSFCDHPVYCKAL